MSDVAIASAIMGGVALASGAVLALAYRFLRVEEDPRTEQVEAMLPGNNCGACGVPGCRAFADAVVAGTANPGKCTVSNAENIQAIAAFLGVEATVEEKRVARLHCAGGAGAVQNLATYAGVASCRAAVLVNGGGRSCTWGCLGLADCERACTFDAIRMNVERLPVVEPERCTACNDCVEACPLDLFELVPVSERLLVQCRTPLAGDSARALCAVACDACGKCALDAGPGVIEMVNGLPLIRQPALATIAATFRCPTGAIQWVEGRQFEDIDLGSPMRSATRRDHAQVAG